MKNIYCIIGNSGCGKTTVAEILHDKYGCKILQSYTTRPKRHESDTDHIYISDIAYEMLPNKVATRVRTDAKYCATAEQIEENDLYVIDFDGLEELKQKYHGNKNIISIYIDVSPDTCEERMKNRGDKPEAIAYRLADDAKNNTLDRINKCDFVIGGTQPLTYAYIWKFIQRVEDGDYPC